MPFLFLGAHFHAVADSKEISLQPSLPVFPKGHCPHLFISPVYILLNFLFRLQMLDISLAPLSISNQSFSYKKEEGWKKKHCLNAEKNRIFKFLFLHIFKSLTADPWERWVQTVAYSNFFHRKRNLASFPFLSFELDHILRGMQLSLMGIVHSFGNSLATCA